MHEERGGRKQGQKEKDRSTVGGSGGDVCGSGGGGGSGGCVGCLAGAGQVGRAKEATARWIGERE